MFQSKTARNAVLHITLTQIQAELAAIASGNFQEMKSPIATIILRKMLELGFAPVVVAFMEEVLNDRADHIVYQSADQIAWGIYPHIEHEVVLQMRDAISIARSYSNTLETVPVLVRTSFAA